MATPGCDVGQAASLPEPVAQAATEPRFPEVIHEPERLTSIDTGELNAVEQPQRVACVTCHALRTDTVAAQATTQLTRFHQGLAFEHGELSCGSCHAEGQPPRLRLADGRKLETSQALQLCAQCHGTQYTDYRHGAHGGMNGYWDTNRGPRLRNHCVDCHDPHSPSIKPVHPKPPPRDRFFDDGADH